MFAESNAGIANRQLVAIPPMAAGLYLALFYVAHGIDPSVVAVERGRVTCRFRAQPSTKFLCVQLFIAGSD